MKVAKLYLRELYASSLKELARVTRKWGVFLCADKRSMKHAIETLCGDGLKLWRFIHCRMINHGGSRVGIYLFKKYDFFLKELNVKNKENTGWMIDFMIEAIYLQNFFGNDFMQHKRLLPCRPELMKISFIVFFSALLFFSNFQFYSVEFAPHFGPSQFLLQRNQLFVCADFQAC